MKRHISILTLIIISATLVIYSYIKTNEAKKYKLELTEVNKQSIELMDDLNMLQKRHIEAAAEARMQKHLAEKAIEELQECQSK